MGQLIFVSVQKGQEELESKALMAQLVLSRRTTRSSVVSEGQKSRIGAEAGKLMSCSMRGRALHLLACVFLCKIGGRVLY